MSKFYLDVLNRCVDPFIMTNDPDVILGSVFGEDVVINHYLYYLCSLVFICGLLVFVVRSLLI